MRCFEILIAESAISKDGGPLAPDNRLTYGIPDEAKELLDPTQAGSYDQDPMWYFDKINFGRPPAASAIAVLIPEYAIGGHVATSRHPDAGIAFTTYHQVPYLRPDELRTRNGVLVFASKSGLEHSGRILPQRRGMNFGMFTREAVALRTPDLLLEEWLTRGASGRSRTLVVGSQPMTHSPIQLSQFPTQKQQIAQMDADFKDLLDPPDRL